MNQQPMLDDAKNYAFVSAMAKSFLISSEDENRKIFAKALLYMLNN